MTDVAQRVLRHEVPVDDSWHDVRLGAGVPVLAVAARRPDVVEFWAIDTPGEATSRRRFRVFGTGQPLPLPDAKHHGTALAAGGALVWHLMEDA